MVNTCHVERQTRLTAGQILRFKLQLRGDVCSTSCDGNPEVRPSRVSHSTPQGCMKQGQSRQSTGLTTTIPSSLSSERLPARTKNSFTGACHKTMSNSGLFSKKKKKKWRAGFRDMDVKICCCHTCSFLPAAARAETLMFLASTM